MLILCNLITNRKSKWFKDNTPKFFEGEGILAGYKQVTSKFLQSKFTEVQKECYDLWNGRIHQTDVSGNLTEADQPIYLQSFYDLFQFLEEADTSKSESKLCKTNVTINRSIIGQKCALSSSQKGELNTTIADPNRERGTGSISDNITMNITEHHHVPTDNRNNNDDNTMSSMCAWNFRLTPPQINRHSHHTGKKNNYSLPSSRGMQGVDVTLMNNHFQSIAGSLNTLTMSDCVRAVHEINNEIIDTYKEKMELMKTNPPKELLDAFEDKIKGLKDEVLGVCSTYCYTSTN